MVPAHFEVIVNKQRTLIGRGVEGELSFIIKSAGMGKQKNMGLRAVRLVQEIHPDLIANVTHDKDKGETRGTWGPRKHRFVILVRVVLALSIV